MLLLVQALFVLYLVLSTAFAKVSVGLPVKDLVLVALFGLLFIAYNRQVSEFVRRHLSVVAVLCVFALLGFCLTILNERGVGTATESMLRIIVQPLLILVSTYVLASLAGPRFTSALFVGAAMVTGGFAILQFVGVDLAWQVRDILSSLQNEPALIRETVKSRQRPMGVSLTPIMYSYHIAAAYIAVHFLYRNDLIKARVYAPFLGIVLVMAAANATRSLVLGILLHEALHRFGRFDIKSMLGIVALGLVGIVGLTYLESIGSRVANLQDASAIGRLVLYDYGLRLAADYPFGFGWGFEPETVAWLYWEHLAEMARPQAALHLALHNAYLNFFLMYGVYGVLTIAFMALIKPRTFVAILFFAPAYLVHGVFHNDGLFLGDDYFWFAFAIFLFVRDSKVAQEQLWVPQPALQMRAR